MGADFMRERYARTVSTFPRPTPVMNEHFDVIIIGTGAGGGSLLNRIAPSGKRILVGKLLHPGRGAVRGSRPGRRRPDRTVAREGLSVSAHQPRAAHQGGL
jgi:hypothetical protein